MDKIEQLLLQYREEMMETVQKWVRLPSVKGDAAPGAPFGVEARKALDAAMADYADISARLDALLCKALALEAPGIFGDCE